MLILSRKTEEAIVINGNIEIRILDIGNGVVKIGINAPKNVEIHRKEIFDKIREENQASANESSVFKNLISKSSQK